MDSQQLLCRVHKGQKCIFICLNDVCPNQNRLGCSRCLLTQHQQHISIQIYFIIALLESCVFIADLKKNAKCWSTDEDDSKVEQFLENQIINESQINKQIDELQQFTLGFLLNNLYIFIDLLKNTKQELIERNIQGQLRLQQFAKNIIKQYLSSTQYTSLKEVLVLFHNKQATKQDVNNMIIRTLDSKSQLLAQYKQNNLSKWLLDLDKIQFIIIQNEFKWSFKNIQNLLTYSNKWHYQVSKIFQKQNPTNLIQESQNGKKFIFNEYEDYQIVYGNQSLPQDKKSQWQLRIEIITDQGENKKENNSSQEMSLSSILSNTMITQNSGIYTQPEYQKLNSFFIGISQLEQKDTISSYVQGSSSCQGMDIIKGRIFGQMYSQGPQNVTAYFNMKKKEGLNLFCTLDPETRKFEIKDSANQLYLCSNLQANTNTSWVPFIYSLKSKIRALLQN